VPTRGESVYGIPLRCYFSRNIANLFFAGRNISATHVAFASTRVMATCAVGAEAVGWALAQCVANGLAPGELAAAPAQVAVLQRTLQRHDVTLVNAPPPLSLAHGARVTASSEVAGSEAAKVLDGRRRDELNSGTGELLVSHQWKSAPLARGGCAWLELAWPAAVAIRELHLTFDTNFGRQLILSASDEANRTCVRGPQPETVRDYTLRLDGRPVASVKGNYSRKRVHRLSQPASARTLRLEVTATNGVPEARVFEMAAY
jgi:hypothetical protein